MSAMISECMNSFSNRYRYQNRIKFTTTFRICIFICTALFTFHLWSTSIDSAFAKLSARILLFSPAPSNSWIPSWKLCKKPFQYYHSQSYNLELSKSLNFYYHYNSDSNWDTHVPKFTCTTCTRSMSLLLYTLCFHICQLHELVSWLTQCTLLKVGIDFKIDKTFKTF